ncbi:MAG: transcriptional regulator, IclR family [Marmoricola sp.]|jgi:IclR family acetate operon transcriptional repressor|nr:transcriptional regulator, IclR family [Marmoricola sp.]
MTKKPTDGGRSYRVGSVSHALDLIDHVVSGPSSGLSLAELTALMELSKSSTYALARTLVDHGYLRGVGQPPRYQLGMALVRLGDRASSSIPLTDICRPVLVKLSQETGLTSRAAINDNGYPVFISRVDSPGPIRFYTPLGVREVPHTSSAGKAMLAMMPAERVRQIVAETGMAARTPKSITTIAELSADLDITRKRGFAIDDEEDDLGVFCIGAAFFRHGSEPAGAVSTTGIKQDRAARQIDVLGRSVQAAADEITQLLTGLERTDF